jgi:predicted DNA binding protein
VISFTERDMRRMISELEKYCELEVVSRRAIPSGAVKETILVSTSSLFGGLTRKQARALVFALENGYYQVPKKVTTEEMATKLRLPRTTYEEHLRKAEGKVLRSMAPYISMGPDPKR